VKFIKKESEPQSFTDWKNLANEDWQPTYDKLGGQEKKEVKNALITEQGSICCYCEKKLEYDDSHIEHLNPQSNSEDERLNFDNLLCSCQQQLKKGEPQHCGNSKGDTPLPITPLQIDCAKKFTYTEDGHISFIDKDSENTLKILQLNIDKLNNLRASAIEPFIFDPITYEILSIEDSKLFAKKYLEKKNGKYNEF
jgi:uncharacterized protein (TIGR02646 family)